MSKIRVLSDNLANKIAAGEVVERPASIVKELIENSIDAGASRIEVAIETGGRRLIRISDDGEGMMRDDAILAFERHATSKIKSAEDLEAIVTLGFRGEALASIASVAKVRLRTQTAEDLVGTEIDIVGGRLFNVRDTPFSRGTEFEVRDIFFNVPARRKFLKSEATESYHVANLVTNYALANHQLSFTLTNNGRESINVSPAANLRERAYQLFGDEFIGDLIEVAGQSDEMRVSGFVSSPSAVRTTRDNQYFFVNRRYVRDRLIARALSEGYRAMVPSGTFPSALLFVELPPHDIDVNVHPAKTEIRFVRSAIVHDLVRDSIRAAISKTRAAATPFGASTIQGAPFPEARPAPVIAAPSFPSTPQRFQREPERQNSQLEPGHESGLEPGPFNLEPLSLPAPAPVQQRINLSFQAPDQGQPTQQEASHAQAAASRLGCLGGRGPSDSANSQLKPAQNLTLHLDEISVIGQLHNSFILATDRAGLLLIDQHVAHERILFEQHWNDLRRKHVEVQRLLIPETLDLTPAQIAAFDQLSHELEENGFELGRLSGRTVAIMAVPAILPPGAGQALLLELLEAIEDDRRGLSMDELRAEIAASLACRAAVKINMSLAPEKMNWMIETLLKMENPATCPHGRPIILRISSREIERGFQRS
ncbi:MAG: DNA mismatch repair endonuclease MutL [Acidobacteriota bacterium]